jgi:hypothetical protein
MEDVKIMLTRKETLEVVGLLRAGAANSKDKLMDMLEEQNNSIYQVYDQEDYLDKGEEAASMKKVADKLEAQLDRQKSTT